MRLDEKVVGETIAIVIEESGKKISWLELRRRREEIEHQPEVNYLDVLDPYAD